MGNVDHEVHTALRWSHGAHAARCWQLPRLRAQGSLSSAQSW